MLNVQSKYLLHRRYIGITWPSIIVATGLITWQLALTAAAIIPIYCWARIHFLFPHETKWLRKAERYARAQDVEMALNVLSQSKRLIGYTARMEAELMRVRLLLTAGKEDDAKQKLFRIDTAAMTDKESSEYQSVLAIFYQQSGDIKAFLDVVAAWDKASILESTDRTLLKGQALQEEGDLVAAREYLEARIERVTSSESLWSLYNNLALISGLAGRAQQQLQYLETAWQHWRKAPHPESMYNLAHNLAIHKVRHGQHDQAREVVAEAYTQIDLNSAGQVLAWSNLSVEIARELGDKQWLAQTRTDLEAHCAALALTASEKISLAVTRLRMDFNDGLGMDLETYPTRLGDLLDSVPLLEEAEQLSALREITHNVEQVLSQHASEQQASSNLIHALLDIHKRCDHMVLERAGFITRQLEALPPRLVNMRQHWLSQQHHLYKVQIRSSISCSDQAIHRLMENQRESAELYQEKGGTAAAMQAWTVFCDEYVAYMQQLPVDMKIWLHKRYHAQAIQARAQLESLMLSRKHTAGLEEYMIALAFFSLVLNKDLNSARCWIDRFNQSGVSINHYAQWLRKQYEWVSSQLAPANQSTC